MPKYNQNITSSRAQVPAAQLDGALQGGNIRVYREIINLGGAGAPYTTADTIVVAYPGAGETFLKGVVTSSVTLGTSTIAIGTSASSGKYRAAATFTAPDTPTLFGVAANQLGVGGAQAAKLLAPEEIIITIGVASLPSSGTLIVDLYFAQT